MKRTALFAFALLIAPAIAQPSFAATSGNEPAAASEPAKAKPAKHKHMHKHEKHTSNTKTHKAT
ncbi:hypothetical protein OGR47_18880 (plasmid) [Methylocystis sp. MJC1]|jgi:hypothetical protein|uniref:hypothetical protein n=1 Tax=Methylocystis sp. MJC1 TaxID=2654282 RepID=UPI0013EA5C8B|nr:hypothetical protein [Methylocystis sp. MJC1]KAF2989038.1 hypothetical protein MJC1_03894 [Methylocystis sp. MJC1]MBU6529023.1 hypothetical protein [Methylocystis sp. MJC1]UZX13968.1 hypothetical protein OGR47_18880 [Methylocystis sp. MJC1]